jgi:hypothetical protein
MEEKRQASEKEDEGEVEEVATFKRGGLVTKLEINRKLGYKLKQ